MMQLQGKQNLLQKLQGKQKQKRLFDFDSCLTFVKFLKFFGERQEEWQGQA